MAEVADEVGEEAGEGTEAASERLLLVLRLCLPSEGAAYKRTPLACPTDDF